jgi:[glutamine synthetase] adenylyltransferase / [glutamine synthetase]-adenylyl-L-tyrosine phosphorylase
MSDLQKFIEELPLSSRARVAQHVAEIEGQIHNSSLAGQFLESMPKVFACSPFVSSYCLRNIDSIPDVSKDVLRAYEAGEYSETLNTAVRDVSDELSLMAALRRVRNREMVRIAWRDIAGFADLEETLTDLSSLAENCIVTALQFLELAHAKRYWHVDDLSVVPVRIVVLGAGKLGGRELNYSSDIDLILAYTSNTTQNGPGSISHDEYVATLGQRLIRILSEFTGDGFVFRVDTLLRPFGRSGPLVMDVGAMEEYYQTYGREWERYALIKVRPVAGDIIAGYELLEKLKPFIYRKYLDFDSLESLREMKRKIDSHEARRGPRDDIKLGSGGIREIEFIVQAFQLIRGGHDVSLQGHSIRPILSKLSAGSYLPDYVVKKLDDAYVYLRRVENRLQEYEDHQEHALPHSQERQESLALSMECGSWDLFWKSLDAHRQFVREQFEQVFSTWQTSDEEATGLGMVRVLLEDTLDVAESVRLLGIYGLSSSDAEAFLTQTRMSSLARNLSESGMKRLGQILPTLFSAVTSQADPKLAISRVWRVLESVGRRVNYLALLAEHPMALFQLTRLCAASPWITDELARHPVLLDELLDTRELYHPLPRSALADELKRHADQVALQDTEAHMSLLRRAKKMWVLHVAASDLMASMPLMVVSDQLTDIAEVILDYALDVSWRQLAQKYGTPKSFNQISGRSVAQEFVVIAYGKFGGIELGYSSDLDLVFLHNGQPGMTEGGERSIDNSGFYVRLGQKIIHMLSMQTPDGIAYPVDMELRPSGRSGILVTNLESFESYQEENAWTWEHQALVRARPVAGDVSMTKRFGAVRTKILTMSRDEAALASDIVGMRSRMRTHSKDKDMNGFDIKRGIGGMIDIEFIVQFYLLRWAHKYPEVITHTDNIRQLEQLGFNGILAQEEAAWLAQVYRDYRHRLHRQELQGLSSVVEENEFLGERARVSDIWGQITDLCVRD